MQIPLFCALIDLIDEGTAVAAPEDVVYSTQPRKATGQDGHSYYVKGPDLNITVAEAVAHQLARNLGLNVPNFGIVVSADTDQPKFASREVPHCLRQVDEWIRRNRAINRDTLPLITAFDVWVVNKDRNIGNIVGEGLSGTAAGRIKLIAIDFEKSMALRGPYPLTTVPLIPPQAMWPSGTLGQLLKGAPIPQAFCERLERFTENDVLGAFGAIESQMRVDIPWKENSAQLLTTRAQSIKRLVAEVWR